MWIKIKVLKVNHKVGSKAEIFSMKFSAYEQFSKLYWLQLRIHISISLITPLAWSSITTQLCSEDLNYYATEINNYINFIVYFSICEPFSMLKWIRSKILFSKRKSMQVLSSSKILDINLHMYMLYSHSKNLGFKQIYNKANCSLFVW